MHHLLPFLLICVVNDRQRIKTFFLFTLFLDQIVFLAQLDAKKDLVYLVFIIITPPKFDFLV